MFKEFNNPLEKDYDISSSLKSGEEIISSPKETSELVMELVDLIGILEDGEWEEYGISEEEYMIPTKETIAKIKLVISSNSKGKHR